MSMSTGDVRRPSGKPPSKAVAADGKKPDVTPGTPTPGTPTPGTPTPGTPTSGAKSGSAKTGAARSGAAKSGAAKSGAKVGPAKAAGARPGLAKAGGGKGRKPMAPINVNQARNWGPILMFAGAGILAIGIIAFAVFAVVNRPDPSAWRERAAAIPAVSVFLQSNPDWFTPPPEGNHKAGPLTYPSTPPVGGVHNGRWQSCMGDVYPAEIPKEQAVHSLEHGAVWITYRPDLPKDQVDRLAERVNGREFLMMSPFPGLDKPISLQAWGYQLKVDNADDDRIDDFITDLRKNATQEPQAGCQGGITDTGSAPLDLPSTEG